MSDAWEKMFRDEREEIEYFLSHEFKEKAMIYSKAQSRTRAEQEFQAEHKHDHLVGKVLTWTEVGDGFEDNLSSVILKTHPNGQSFYVNEADEPRWIVAGPYVKNIRIEE